METYKGKINEFINWVNGENSVSGNVISGVDSEHPISGQSIRELIQEHLKVPFVTNDEDEDKDKIYFFSSEDAKSLWKQYSKKGSPLYDEDKANSLVLYSMDLPATFAISGLDSFQSARYIIEGNTNSENAILSYVLGLRDSLGSEDSDVITVTYTIEDASGNINYNESYQVATGERINKNVYQYLKSGDNSIYIKAVANNHSAQILKNFHIFLVKFSIDSNFNGYYNGVSNGMPITFDVSVNRSITNLPFVVKVYIDNIMDENNAAYTWTYTSTEATPRRKIEIANNYLASDYEENRKHTLVIRGTMQDPETGSTFKSNILVYDFEVRSALGDLTNQFVNYSYSIPSASYVPLEEEKKIVLQATQYIPFTLNWGYYSDGGYQQSNIEWLIRTGVEGNYQYNEIVSILGISGIKPDQLNFIVSNPYVYDEDNSVLIARANGAILEEFPIDVAENNININEKENYSLKLSAYGKTNSSTSKSEWIDYDNNVTTTFSGVNFDNITGWDGNSLLLKGQSATATINYCPFPSTYNSSPFEITKEGSTFEIDFKPEYVNSEDDILLTIGNISGSHIRITPNSAAYYEGGSAIVKTNFKSGERIKLAFVFNRISEISSSSNLVYIINNGILERAGARGISNIVDDSSRIVIGGSESSIRVYMIRAYRFDITPKEALDNYMFDNLENSALISRNDVYKNSAVITYAGLQGKQDLIIIEGDLSNILRNASDKKNATVNIRRESNTQSDKNFTITDCRIRNHGQSTLSYPITSMKIWFNKSNKFVPVIDAQGNTTLQETNPIFNCQSQSYLGLNKNRYLMKEGSIPSNKFVLQANYADSSGAHNGSLLRLIQDTWYNAIIDGEFKLRTAPQLFASGMHVTHNNPNLGENNWTEGVCNIESSRHYGKTWSEISGMAFPYDIRVAPDSFPCTVFYRDTSTGDRDLTLLGQYVFMDDKKSDYVYGERSIYYTDDPTDPFCLKTENKKKDVKDNRVWDNDNVLHVEVVYPNSPLTSYSSKTIADTYTLDENDVLIPSGNQHRFDDVMSRDINNNPTEYYWEQHFELIYPDKEDIVDDNNVFDSQKFQNKIAPFTDFLEWITDVSALRNTGNKLGATGSKARVSEAEINKFIAEAAQHLDLYKLAAYYIFFLRFGLVDSVERNAQLKTYDGQHWHYEPWDMDIALGCANNGVIAYNPPIDRNTKAGGDSYAFSGRTATQSNALWDCLECWDYWSNTIVPEVAQALYDAGLTYNNASKMFDEEYVEKWSETLYNESGQYKYIEATSDGTYRRYLNGARTSHRHWWLSTSMNYYDAKWSCGDFATHAIEFRINKSADITGNNIIKIHPTNNTFFKAQYGSKGDQIVSILGDGLTEATMEPGGEAQIDANIQLDDKQPTFIFGANSIEELDLSTLLINSQNNLGRGYMDIKFSGAYDDVLGARLKVLKLGAPCTPNLYTTPNANSYESNLTVGQNTIISSSEGKDALANLELLDVVGWYSKQTIRPGGSWLSEVIAGKPNVHTIYAMGCNTVTEFSSSTTGNHFNDLRLPNTITALQFTNSNWDNISFWETTDITSTRARYDKTDIPATISTIVFSGTTARNECSLDLVLDWIDSIENTLPAGHTEQDLLNLLSQSYTFQAEQINWGLGTTKIYYRDVIRLGHLRKGSMIYNLKGYIVISDQENLTSLQLSELENLFGNNVFNVGTMNTNLVIDQDNGFVRISSNAQVDQVDDALLISEPNSINLSATKFTLSANSLTNVVVGTEENYTTLQQSRNPNIYLWGLSINRPQNESDHMAVTSSVKSCTLDLRNNGGIKLVSKEGDFGDYSLWVSVYYYDEDSQTVNYDSVKIKVTGVTYPEDFTFGSAGIAPREFLYTSDIARTLFGTSVALQSPLPKVYVMYTRDQETEFFINKGSGYTATINSIKYYLEDLNDSSHNSGNLTEEELSSGDSTLYYIEPIDSKIAYSKDATRGGIKLRVAGNPPGEDIKTYRLYATISIGGRSVIQKSILIMLYDDSNYIVQNNSVDYLYTLLQTKYRTQYNLPQWNGSFYKTDMLSLYGTLSIDNQNFTYIDGTDGYSILHHLRFISSISITNCPNLTFETSQHHFTIDLEHIYNLTSLTINNCSSLGTNTLDLTGHQELTTLSTVGTNLGVTLPVGSNITTLQLGTPQSVYIDRPVELGNVGTTYSSVSSSELTSLVLKNININNVAGFNVFNSLYH